MSTEAPPSPALSYASDDFDHLLEAEWQTPSDNNADGVESYTEEDHYINAVEDSHNTEKVPEAEAEAEAEEEEEEEEDEEEEGNGMEKMLRKRSSDGSLGECSRRLHQKKSSSDDSTDLGQKDEENVSVRGSCPPHPGYMWGVCIRCGAHKADGESDCGRVALRYIHQELEVSEMEAARLRQGELKQLLDRKKLYLVLDLDHTMLNSARFMDVPTEESTYLVSTYCTKGKGNDGGGSLHRLDHLHMWTKLRPFALKFIEAASKFFEIYLYTMGERIYAHAMAQLLDPKGRFFGSRVISQGESTNRHSKDLDIMLSSESAVIILDDTEAVWPKHKANLIVMERYHFFSSSCKQFGITSASLAEAWRDETEDDGALANVLNVLRSIHEDFFSTIPEPKSTATKNSSIASRDVREVIRRCRSKNLCGCKVVFSRIFPTGMPNPHSHPLWRLTEDLGAVCMNTLDSSVTHVIALDKGTDKAKWAQQNKKYLVHPRWVEAASYIWKRPREEDFSVGDESNFKTTFASTSSMEPLNTESEEIIEDTIALIEPVDELKKQGSNDQA